jgi:hypothetical protein
MSSFQNAFNKFYPQSVEDIKLESLSVEEKQKIIRYFKLIYFGLKPDEILFPGENVFTLDELKPE